ncbi:hypothetical protein CFP56_000595 [Quercus suber]|uniref:Uncharacterized protein n=1 Tax=Quercus suber TaxID=58331 RepID=A0AAW0IP55_QUESU
MCAKSNGTQAKVGSADTRLCFHLEPLTIHHIAELDFAFCPTKAFPSGFENTPLLPVLCLLPKLRSATLLLPLAACSSTHLSTLAP